MGRDGIMAKRPSRTRPAVAVRNIDELAGGIPRADKLLVHFANAQWAGLTRGLKRSRRMPKRGVVFAYTPLPDGSGGIGAGDCISGPCEICLSRPGRGPDDPFALECHCRRDPACPPD